MQRITNETRKKAIEWLLSASVGESSKSMLKVTLGLKPKHAQYPRDPADFNRCVQLLKSVPELKSRIKMMEKYGPQWKELVSNWDKLEALFISEAGENWSTGERATLTWKAMKGMGC